MATGKGKIAAAWLTNPVVIYGAGGLVVLLAAYFILPKLFGGFKVGFGKAWDGFFNALATLFPGNADQKLADRTRADEVAGLVSQGDRSLSDLWDSPLSFAKKLILGKSDTGGVRGGKSELQTNLVT